MPMFKGILAKEGKGVEKNASAGKSAFWLFLELYSRKFWRICQAGITYLILSIPTLAVVWFLCAGLISTEVMGMVTFILQKANGEIPNELIMATSGVIDIFIRSFVTLLFMALWGTGPATAGFTYIMRN